MMTMYRQSIEWSHMSEHISIIFCTIAGATSRRTRTQEIAN